MFALLLHPEVIPPPVVLRTATAPETIRSHLSFSVQSLVSAKAQLDAMAEKPSTEGAAETPVFIDDEIWLKQTVSSSSSLTGSTKNLRTLGILNEWCEKEGNRKGLLSINGFAGSGKTHLLSVLQKRLRCKSKLDFVVTVDFVEAGNKLKSLSWKKLAEYLVEKGELNSSDQSRFVELSESKSGNIVILLDNVPEDLLGCLKRLLYGACGDVGEDNAPIFEGIVERLVKCIISTADEISKFLNHELQSLERKLGREALLRIESLTRILGPSASFLKQLLFGPGGRVFVSRYDLSDNIVPQHLVHSITIGGFTAGTALLFIKQQLSLKGIRSQPLELYLTMHPVIKSLCNLPGMIIILCDIYCSNSRCIKDTETSLVHKMLLCWMKKELPEFKESSLYKMPQEAKEHFMHICRLAFCGVRHRVSRRQDEPFPLTDIEVNAINLRSGFSSLEEVKNFGLFQSKGNTIKSFIHPVIQEFLAAFYISCEPQNNQILFYNEEFEKKIDSFLNVSLFHFGFTRLETEEFLNPSKIILAAMIESLTHVAGKKTEDKKLYLELQKLIVGCLYEAQDTTLVKHFTQQYTPLMDMTFPDVRALDDARMTSQMIYVILQSGINDWKIFIPNENIRGKTDSLVFPISMVPDTSVKIEVKVSPSLVQSFNLRAIFEPQAQKKTGRATEMIKKATNDEEKEMYFKLAMICTGQRETLHRVTQLYSPVPVRSDAGDPAYASLITCDCVEKTLEKEVRFEPIHPIHMVQLGPKSKKAKAAENNQDMATKRHMDQKHKSCYMEMIVLNRPSVKSITFQPPGGGQPCRLVMSGEKDSPSTSGRIAMEAEIEKSLDDCDSWVSCVAVVEKEHSKSKMVAHGLPLPKSKSKLEADKGSVLQGNGVSGSRVHNDDVDVPATAAQVAPSHKHFQDQDLLPYQSPALAQAESSEKITWRPGMIMHSVRTDCESPTGPFYRGPSAGLLQRG